MGFETLGSAVFSKAAYNRNLAALERMHGYGLGHGILSGLVPSAGSGLTLNITAGVMNSGAKVVNFDALTATMDDNVTRYVWLNEGTYNSSTGYYVPTVTLSATNTDPGSGNVCIGKVTTLASSITAVDTTSSTGGRMTGFCWSTGRLGKLGESLLAWDLINARIGVNVASPAYPFDLSGQGAIDQVVSRASGSNPTNISGAGIVYTRTANSVTDLYYIDSAGNATQITTLGQIVLRPLKITLGYAAFAAAATTSEINLGLTLPAGGYVRTVKIKHSTAFSGGAVAACTLQVGITGTANRYAAAFDVFSAVSATNYQVTNPNLGESHTATTTVKCTLTTTGANTNALTAGSVDVWVDYVVMA